MESLSEVIQTRLEDGQLSCLQAFAIARDLKVSPRAVGQAANEAGIRIYHCQLGLFGYGPKAEGKHKAIRAMENTPEGLAAALRTEASAGEVRCAALWRVADRLAVERIDAASAAEAMGLRVSFCQLGCFPRAKKG